MATMIEKQEASIRKEIEKLEKSLERNRAAYEKKRAKAEKVGAADWTLEEFRNRLDNGNLTLNQDTAYFEMSVAIDRIADVEKRLENAKSRLAKILPEVETVKVEKAEAERIEAIESGVWSNLTEAERKSEYEKWFKEFKAECKKDGIEIEKADSLYIDGKTARGDRFSLSINNGYTIRSQHCYTLYINGNMIFSSGEFGTAYNVIRQK